MAKEDRKFQAEFPGMPELKPRKARAPKRNRRAGPAEETFSTGTERTTPPGKDVILRLIDWLQDELVNG